jgi:ectoine hydroxylase-related dioxygenase (phytanoyl-CoA dioxygenase family)
MIDAHLEAIAENGYTILEGAIDHAQVDAILQALDSLVEKLGTVPSKNLFEGHRTLRAYNLLAHGKRFEEIPVQPDVLSVVEGVLDAGCLVSSLSSIDIRPDESAQMLHADDQLLPLEKPHVPIVCNTMWALTDFTEANGATRLVPGSHREPGNPVYGEDYATIAAEMPKGSVLIWNGSLWHGGGANQSDERRVGIAMNYCAGYIRQQENQQLGVPRGIASGFPERLKRLVGYGIYNGLIGHIDKRDPIELVDANAPGEGVLWDRG